MTAVFPSWQTRQQAWRYSIWNRYVFDHEVYAEFSTFYLLLNFGEEESKNVRKNVRQMLDELKAQESILNGMNVTIGMGSMVNTAGSIKKSFLDAVFMIKQRLLLGTGRMLEMDEAQQRKTLIL